MRTDLQPMVLRPADYSPDMPALQNPGSDNIINAIPRTPNSYGPFPQIALFGGPVDTTALGAFAVEDSLGSNYLFAGTTANLWQYSSAFTSTPVNVSKGGGYTTSSTERFRFLLFGQNVLATNFTNPIQSFVIGTSTQFADLSATAPQSRYIAAVRGFAVMANTNDPTGGLRPQRVWWSGLNDPTNWPTPGTSLSAQFQSSFNDLFGNGGWNQGIVGNLGNADGVIFQERAIWRMTYVGPPDVFDFQPVEGMRGTPAPNSIVQLGGTVFYLGIDGFYAYDGATSTPIGVNRVDKTFFAMLDQNNYGRIDGSVDPINKIIYWAFPATNNNMGNPNYMLAYHWQLDKWALISLGNTPIETLFFSISFGYTLDNMPGGPLDAIIPPLDSRVWTGGSLLLSCFDSNHNLSYFNGSPMAATIETSESQPFPGELAFVQNTRPLVDGGVPSVAIAVRNRLVDQPVYGNSITMNAIGTCPITANGRYVRGEVVIPAGTNWTHFQGLEAEGIPNGVM